MLDANFFRKVGPDISACFRRYIFGSADGGKSAKDIFGKKYKPYSTEYKELKKTGSLFRQASQFKDSTAPVLTSDLARDFKAFSSSATGFGFGAVSQRGKVKSLAKMGRVIYTDAKPLPDECSEFIMKELTKDVKGAFKKIRKKIKRKKININIGK